MELDSNWLDMGLLGLLLATFLAATVIPFSSEVVFLSFLALGYTSMQVVIVASIGNWLGGMCTFGIGWYLPLKRLPKWVKVDRMKLDRWVQRVRRKGAIWGFLCWLPIIGDIIALALGAIRVPVLLTGAYMMLGKAARYGILAWSWGVI